MLAACLRLHAGFSWFFPVYEGAHAHRFIGLDEVPGSGQATGTVMNLSSYISRGWPGPKDFIEGPLKRARPKGNGITLEWLNGYPSFLKCYMQ